LRGVELAGPLNIKSCQLKTFVLETIAAVLYVLLVSIAGVFLSIYALVEFGNYIFDFGSAGVGDGWPGIVLLLCVISGFALSFGVGCITAKPLWKKLTACGLNGRRNG